MTRHEHTFVLGGCKSGKSRYAQKLAESLTPGRRLYLATCVPLDQEMRDRVRRHQDDRDRTWFTVETPLDIAEIIRQKSSDHGVILLDCLTLWVTNMIMEDMEQPHILEKTRELCGEIKQAGCPVVAVSNEVGAGIVPENKLARMFRDVQGIVNQIVASELDRVVVTFAGIPMTLKGKAAM
ncbi:MAG: bifunctional adenosylcobinamide kinase/adenosylcobinamide-phosphate guanylyltransferase [Desulfobacteraceae bacterium]|jgi:adenosylcobinamide kinase/adenosylcobinamide-phosphate guanylyltransferase